MRSGGSGGDRLGRALREGGHRTVFGVPGTQNIGILEGLRRARVRLVAGSSELPAAFMANGFARVSGRPALLFTIPGPGFTHALAGVAEAHLDSVPLVWFCVAPAPSPDGRRTLQALPQERMAAPVVKGVLPLDPGGDPAEVLGEALTLACDGEPGPVLVHLDPAFAEAPAGGGARPGGLEAASTDAGAPSGSVDGASPEEAALRGPGGVSPHPEALRDAVGLLSAARRPLFYVGQGAFGAVDLLRGYVRARGCPVLTTTSGRGAVPEDDPHVLVADDPAAAVGGLNELVASSDLVVVLGCGLSHNGSHGFGLELPEDRLLWVNTRPGGPPPPYAARLSLRADAREFLEAVVEAGEGVGAGEAGEVAETAPGRAEGDGSGWTPAELSAWKGRLAAAPDGGHEEPHVIVEGARRGMDELFAGLRAALPPDGILVTDSGRHQVLARRHFRVLEAGGLLAPADLQSMGFALPAGIGAKLAAPHRPVVALVGDGGFRMTAMELLVARAAEAPVCTVVFRDGEFALIADQQRGRYGRSYSTRVENPELAGLAGSLGVRYLPAGADFEALFRRALSGGGSSLVDVPLGGGAGSRAGQARALIRESARRAVGPERVSGLKRLTRRFVRRLLP